MITRLAFLLACTVVTQSGNPAAGKPWHWKSPTQLVTLSSSRIVGGIEAVPHSYPYLAALFIDDMYFCTGSLISNEWVMTAAHCMDGASYVDVVMGAEDILQDESMQVTMTSTSFFIHENWSSTSVANDITLIRLPSPVAFSEYIQAASLPSSDIHEGDLVTIIGWGRALNSAPRFSYVLEVPVSVISNKDCSKYYPNVWNGVVCVNTTSGTCGTGTSGNPLIKDGKTYGIASFGAAAGCEASYPYVFTRVHYYLDWIEAVTGITP